MKDALQAAPGGGLDYYSYEPFQIYAPGAVTQMSWVTGVGDLWRSSNDIRPQWKSVLENAFLTNTWAPNARAGHYNDADELEIGNGQLTLAEQRSHFALWCVMKSPLIIGTGVLPYTDQNGVKFPGLANASLAILLNKRLVAINQDALGVQGTFRAAFDGGGKRAPTIPAKPVECVTPTSTQAPAPTPAPAQALPAPGSEPAGEASASQPAMACAQASPWVTHCTFGDAVGPAQRWATEPSGHVLGGEHLIQASNNKCLSRSAGATAAGVSVVDCDASKAEQAWDIGVANVTVAQVRDVAHPGSCLTFDAVSLHMAPCLKEAGDKTEPNPTGCHDGNCRFSGIIYQLWYLNSLGQVTSAITNIANGANQLLPMIDNFPSNTPWCLASSPNTAPMPPAPPPAVDTAMPLQVWAGPLSGGDVVVLLLNTGNSTQPIVAGWDDIGLSKGQRVAAMDLWSGKALGTYVGTISAKVASHDSAVFRLSPLNRGRVGQADDAR